MRRGLLIAAFVVACAGRLPPPKRRVIEGDLEGWTFGRYQRATDVEVYLPGTQAVQHGASYARDEARRRGTVTDEDVVNAVVTEYDDARTVASGLVRFVRRLAQESGYVVDEGKLGGQRVFKVGGHGEAWVFWWSGRYIVKVGGRGLKAVPSGVVSAYGRRYPSRLRSGDLDRPIEEPTAPKEARP